MKIYFLSGFFDDLDQNNIILNSKGNIQNAANILQKKYISGFIQYEKVSKVEVINLPYLGSYPKHYKKVNFKTTVDVHMSEKLTINNVSYCNLMFYKNISRLRKSFFKAYKILKLKNKEEEALFFIYAMHLPFLIAAFLLKILFSEIKFIVIVPDLPEFMSNRKGFIAVFYNFFAKISYFIVNQMDGVVVLTEQMKNRFSENLKKIVIEGIASTRDFDNITNINNSKEKFFLYSGTLDNRYGLKDLLDSYSKVPQENNVKLYICGEGPDKKTIIQAAKNNHNIKYLGILPREEVLALQKKAILLINPRNDKNEFTKYSFPSKVLEYMSSGTPVLMYKLSGIPMEYFQYVYTIENNVNSFTEMLIKISNLDSDTLFEKGKLAKKFVEDYKNPVTQVEKILDYLG